MLPPIFNFMGLSRYILDIAVGVGNSGGYTAVSSGDSSLDGKTTSDTQLWKKYLS